MSKPKEVTEYLEKRGKARRGRWGIADLRPDPGDPVHNPPLFGTGHADEIKRFVKKIKGAVDDFTSPSGNKGYYVLEWRLTPVTKLDRKQMEYVAQAKTDVERKKRLKDCGVDLTAGCGCGCGCGE